MSMLKVPFWTKKAKKGEGRKEEQVEKREKKGKKRKEKKQRCVPENKSFFVYII